MTKRPRTEGRYLIITKRDPPPVPSTINWTAYLDGHEERGSGFGPTEGAAVRDLLERLFDE